MLRRFCSGSVIFLGLLLTLDQLQATKTEGQNHSQGICTKLLYQLSNFPRSKFAPRNEDGSLPSAGDHKEFAKGQVELVHSVVDQISRGVSPNAIFADASERKLLAKRQKALRTFFYYPVKIPFLGRKSSRQITSRDNLAFRNLIREQQKSGDLLQIDVADLFGTRKLDPWSQGGVISSVKNGLDAKGVHLSEKECFILTEEFHMAAGGIKHIFLASNNSSKLPPTLIVETMKGELGWFHRFTSEEEIQQSLGKMFSRLQRLADLRGASDLFLDEFCNISFLYYNLMPFQRGSAGFGNAFLAGYYSAYLGKPLPFIDGVDRYALSMSEEKFRNWLKKEINRRGR